MTLPHGRPSHHLETSCPSSPECLLALLWAEAIPWPLLALLGSRPASAPPKPPQVDTQSDDGSLARAKVLHPPTPCNANQILT